MSFVHRKKKKKKIKITSSESEVSELLPLSSSDLSAFILSETVKCKMVSFHSNKITGKMQENVFLLAAIMSFIINLYSLSNSLVQCIHCIYVSFPLK